MVVSGIHQRESVTIICVPSFTALPPHPHSTPQGYHRVPGWASCVIQWFPIGYLFYTYGNPLQYSRLGNPMDTGAWKATVHGVAKGWTPLKWLSMSIYMSMLLSQFVLASPFEAVSTGLFSSSVSPFLLCKYVHQHCVWCLLFSFWLSLCMTSSGIAPLTTTDSNLFFFMVEQCSIAFMCHIFFRSSSVDGYLGCFHVLAIV